MRTFFDGDPKIWARDPSRTAGEAIPEACSERGVAARKEAPRRRPVENRPAEKGEGGPPHGCLFCGCKASIVVKTVEC
jgi:hypothetical protein